MALNISADIDRTLIVRGDWLLSHKPPPVTERISVGLTTETLLNENQPVHIYHGAARTAARLNLLNAKSLPPSGQGVAGAQVVEINSPKRYKCIEARLYRIAALNQPEKLIYHIMEQLLAAGKLQQTRGWLHLPEHKICFSEAEEDLWRQVSAEFKRQGQAMWVRELADNLAQE